MSFKSISIKKYIKLHLKNNPDENKADLKKRLLTALNDYKDGVKCFCGNDIWVVGSASVGNSCFTCITGESMPEDDYEIEAAIHKRENHKGRRHIDDMDPHKLGGYFTDDGYEINIDLIKKPNLCLSCIHNDDPHEEMLCNLTRLDQQEGQEFKCYAYKKL